MLVCAASRGSNPVCLGGWRVAETERGAVYIASLVYWGCYNEMNKSALSRLRPAGAPAPAQLERCRRRSPPSLATAGHELAAGLESWAVV